jgi:hypothetical protein
MVGGAAKGIASRLERLGYELGAEPVGVPLRGGRRTAEPRWRGRRTVLGSRPDLVPRAMAVTGPRHLPPDLVGDR